MRKLILMLLGIAMALAACNKAEEFAVVDAKEAVYTLKVNANDGIQTRSGEITELETIGGYTTRYILEIYHSSSDKLYQRIVQYQGQAGVATPNEFNFRLVTNQKYEFLVWIDYAKSDAPDTDLHYDTESLKNVSVKGDYINNDHTRDAFCGNLSEVTMGSTSQTFEAITCKRPFGQLNIVTTDWNHVKNAPALLPTAVQIKYQGYSSFNVSDGGSVIGEPTTDFTYKVGGAEANQALIGNATNEGVQKLTCDYLFASSDAFVDTKITFYNGVGNEITHTDTDLANLPIKRNYKTNVSGNLLTKKGDITVKVDAEWANTMEISIELDQLQNILSQLNENSPEYVYISIIGEGLNAPNSSGYYTFLLPQAIGKDNINLKHLHINFKDGIELRHSITMFYANPSKPYKGLLTFESGDKKGGSLDFAFPDADVHFKGFWNTVGPRSTKNLTIEAGADVEWMNCQAASTENMVWEIKCYGKLDRATMSNNQSGTKWYLNIHKYPGSINPTVSNVNANGDETIAIAY